MTSADLAGLYDAHYYRTYRGAPYERSELWLAHFGAMADGIIRDLNPGTVLDVGCALGLLVEALRARGVDAYGVDLSPHAIDHVHDDVKPYCWVGSVLDPPTRQYDLVVCHEVLEHLPPEDADRAVANLCQVADDVLFSSSADDFAEDTHLNVRPMEYWAGLFAKHGFVRDVDFDPLAVGQQATVRFRRTDEPLYRIVANFERRISRLADENVALRLRALETKRLLAQHEATPAKKSTAPADIAAMEVTIAEQAVHLDAQAERLRFMADREGDLRALLHDAHEQLLRRDEDMAPLRQELDERAKVIEGLDRVVKERTEWAERMVAEAEARSRVIDDLQRVIEERTAWAERMVAEVEARGRVIDELRRATEDRQTVGKGTQAADAGRSKRPAGFLARGYRRLRGPR